MGREGNAASLAEREKKNWIRPDGAFGRAGRHRQCRPLSRLGEARFITGIVLPVERRQAGKPSLNTAANKKGGLVQETSPPFHYEFCLFVSHHLGDEREARGRPTGSGFDGNIGCQGKLDGNARQSDDGPGV